MQQSLNTNETSEKKIPNNVLLEWQEDLEVFAAQVVEGLPEDKADQIQSVIHLAGSLIKEVLVLRHHRWDKLQTRTNLMRRIDYLERTVKLLQANQPGETMAKT